MPKVVQTATMRRLTVGVLAPKAGRMASSIGSASATPTPRRKERRGREWLRAKWMGFMAGMGMGGQGDLATRGQGDMGKCARISQSPCLLVSKSPCLIVIFVFSWNYWQKFTHAS